MFECVLNIPIRRIPQIRANWSLPRTSPPARLPSSRFGSLPRSTKQIPPLLLLYNRLGRSSRTFALLAFVQALQNRSHDDRQPDRRVDEDFAELSAFRRRHKLPP